MIVKPETLIGWHRKGFKVFWKSKSRVGRPRLPENTRKLIVRMALENPTWGQARVAAELSVKLGIYVSPRTVRAYWPPKSGPRDHTEPSRSTGRRLSAIMLSPLSPAISSLSLHLGFESCMCSSSWSLGRGASCTAISPRTQRRSGPCNSFETQFQPIMLTAFSFATAIPSSR